MAAKVRNAYNAALALGYADGLKLNNPQRFALLSDLHARLHQTDREAAERNRDKWNDRGWELYSRELAIQFQKHHLKV